MAVTQQPEKREIAVRDLPTLVAKSSDARKAIAPFLPEGVSLDRVAASLHVALTKDRAAWKKEGPTPLERCSPMSVFMAVAKIVQWGLEAGETAHLVPFGAECVPVAGYKGIVELVMGSGVVRGVHVRCRYENEFYRETVGTTVEVVHRPIGLPSARGALVGAYVIFDLRGGALPVVKYMSVEEIDIIRQKYSKQHKEGKVQAWYAEKTVIIHGAKVLPKNPRLAKTLAVFDQIEAAELSLAIPDGLRQLESGTASFTLPDEREETTPRVAASSESVAPQPAEPPARERSTREDAFDGAEAIESEDASLFSQPAAEATGKPQHAEGGPACPKCEGLMWDNRNAKRNPKAPDFKCKGRECEGVIWPAGEGEVRDAQGNRQKA